MCGVSPSLITVPTTWVGLEMRPWGKAEQGRSAGRGAAGALAAAGRGVRHSAERLEKEVARVGDLTAFSTLFIDTTENVAIKIRQLPEVAKIDEIPNAEMALLQTITRKRSYNIEQ